MNACLSYLRNLVPTEYWNLSLCPAYLTWLLSTIRFVQLDLKKEDSFSYVNSVISDNVEVMIHSCWPIYKPDAKAKSKDSKIKVTWCTEGFHHTFFPGNQYFRPICCSIEICIFVNFWAFIVNITRNLLYHHPVF